MSKFIPSKIVNAELYDNSNNKIFKSVRSYICNYENDPSDFRLVHAEIALLTYYEKLYLSGKFNKPNIDIFVYRICQKNKTGYGMAKPCKNCVMSMFNSKIIKIKNIYYTDEDGNIRRINIKNLINDENLLCWR